MRIIKGQGTELLLNRLQCIRDFISNITTKIEELTEQREECCEAGMLVLDENEDPVEDEDENNINF